MHKTISYVHSIVFLGGIAMTYCSTAACSKSDKPKALLKTSMGDIQLELNAEKAPMSVENFKKYCQDGFYANTVFHRVIPNFMIQGGGLTADLNKKPTRSPIKNEATNGLKNLRGTLAMARTSVINSATAQFFINTVDNAFLDHKDTSAAGYGYAVFGKVIKGMDVVEKIRKVATTTVQGRKNVPKKPIKIQQCIWQG